MGARLQGRIASAYWHTLVVPALRAKYEPARIQGQT